MRLENMENPRRPNFLKTERNEWQFTLCAFPSPLETRHNERLFSVTRMLIEIIGKVREGPQGP